MPFKEVASKEESSIWTKTLSIKQAPTQKPWDVHAFFLREKDSEQKKQAAKRSNSMFLGKFGCIWRGIPLLSI